MLLLKITLISWDKPTCFWEELKTILNHCEQLLIRMSSIWESSCSNQIWPRQNFMDIYWISAQIKLFHFPPLLWWRKKCHQNISFPNISLSNAISFSCVASWRNKNLWIICHRANIVQAFENYVPYVMDPRYMFSHY